ncbi:MAG: hypothetical protein V1834_01500 [Candidatus Micrarchaeota archaeon]
MRKTLALVFALIVLSPSFSAAIPDCNDFFKFTLNQLTYVPVSNLEGLQGEFIRIRSYKPQSFYTATDYVYVLTKATREDGRSFDNGEFFWKDVNSSWTFQNVDSGVIDYYCDGVKTDELKVSYLGRQTLKVYGGDLLEGSFLRLDSEKSKAFVFDSFQANRSFKDYLEGDYVLIALGEYITQGGLTVPAGSAIFELPWNKDIYYVSGVAGAKYAGCCADFCEQKGEYCASTALTSSTNCFDNHLLTYSCGFNRCVSTLADECLAGCDSGACLPEAETTCKDSDNGLNYLLQGTVSGVLPSTQQYSLSDECLDKKQLKEYYCAQGGVVKSQIYECTGECSAGVCVASQEVEHCTDSDGGVDYANAGTCVDAFGGHADYCKDGTIVEYSCSVTEKCIEHETICNSCAGEYCPAKEVEPKSNFDIWIGLVVLFIVLYIGFRTFRHNQQKEEPRQGIAPFKRPKGRSAR